MTKLQVTGNRVLVELDEVSGKTHGGLYVPQTADRPGPKAARVRGVSPRYFVGQLQVTSEFYEGELVLVDLTGAAELELDGKKLHCVRNEEVVGHLKESA